MMNIDLWYGNTLDQIEAFDYSFSDLDCIYRGNFYIDDQPVGDFSCSDSVELEKFCPGIFED